MSPLLLVAVLSLSAAPKKGAAPTAYVLDPARSSVRFDLPTTLHDVHGEAGGLSGGLQIDPKAGITGTVEVKAAEIHTGLDVRDERLASYVLDAKDHPNLSFQLAEVTGDAAGLRAGTGAGDVGLRGTLTIRGVSHQVVAPARYTWTDGNLTLTGLMPISWADFGIPDASIPISHVASEVSMKFNVAMRPGA